MTPSSQRFTEMALNSSFDIPDGPRHMMAGACGGVVGSFATWKIGLSAGMQRDSSPYRLKHSLDFPLCLTQVKG